MFQFESVDSLQQQVLSWRNTGQRIAFVPTMGNLHRGHLGLVDFARSLADRVVVSIYINPLQFNDTSDLGRYPVTLAADQQQLQAVQADALYLPQQSHIYPYGLERSVRVDVPQLSEVLEGAHRPGHFSGVTTVVTKLFNIVQPDIAVFGEKDRQQFLLIRRMVADLMMPLQVLSAPTAREPDGLAMSSRNGFLTADERARASLLYQVLADVRLQWQAANGHCNGRRLEQEAVRRLETAGWRPEYVSIRYSDDLVEAQTDELIDGADYFVLAAAWLGDTRLIDNIRL